MTISKTNHWFHSFFILTMLLAHAAQCQPGSKPSYDVVVYGATAGGVMAAIAASREGASVLLVEPGRHLGGMLTGGLSHTDYGDRSVIGGLALEFYERVAKSYGKPVFFWRGPEPHVGEQILRDWLKEAKVAVVYGKRIKETLREGRTVRRIRMLDDSEYAARVFVDGGYEGDLMARAGISYAIGREGVAQYGESWAGRQPVFPDGHNFRLPVSPFINGKDGALLPLINPRPLAAVGAADSAVQAYCFRLLMTNNPANRVTITRPEGYDSTRFELLRRYLQVRKPTNLGETGVIGPYINLPNQKAEINSGGPISTNLYDGSNWPYPDAGYPQRDAIWRNHLDYTHGLLYFISHDSSVPENIRREALQWGLCKDEFADTGHWPHQLYIRVARRMLGEYVLTQHDLEKHVVKYDAIGMGSYNIDVRHVQRTWQWISRFPELRGETFNEGYMSIPVPAYEIPYRSLLPRYEECDNVLVPVCLSSSQLACASIRMEPQYMLLGHAAGVAAATAARQKVAVQRVDINFLQKRLVAQRQIISLQDNPYGFFGQGKDIVLDDDTPRFMDWNGSWSESENPDANRYGITYRHSSRVGKATFLPRLTQPGTYRLYMWWPASRENAADVPIEITHRGGRITQTVDQQQNGGRWMGLGTFLLDAGSQINVISTGKGTVVADAVRLEWVE